MHKPLTARQWPKNPATDSSKFHQSRETSMESFVSNPSTPKLWMPCTAMAVVASRSAQVRPALGRRRPSQSRALAMINGQRSPRWTETITIAH